MKIWSSSEALPTILHSKSKEVRPNGATPWFSFKIHKLLDLPQKPAVNFREVENLVEGEAGAAGVADEEDALAPQARDQFVPQSGIAWEDVAVAINFRADANHLFFFYIATSYSLHLSFSSILIIIIYDSSYSRQIQ